MIPMSCVNQEVIKYNRQVWKIMKPQSKVKILELNLGRHSFPTHGLHLNSRGKKIVSQDLAQLIRKSLDENQIHSAISIPWKDRNRITLDSEPQVGEIEEEINNLTSSGFELPNGERNEESNMTFPSYPTRNCPARRNPDFLWT